MTYEIHESQTGFWVVAIPLKGRRQRLACYKTRAMAEADKREREKDERSEAE